MGKLLQYWYIVHDGVGLLPADSFLFTVPYCTNNYFYIFNFIHRIGRRNENQKEEKIRN